MSLSLFDQTVYQMVFQKPINEQLKFIDNLQKKINEQKFNIKIVYGNGYNVCSLIFLNCVENIALHLNQCKYLLLNEFYNHPDHPYYVRLVERLKQKSICHKSDYFKLKVKTVQIGALDTFSGKRPLIFDNNYVNKFLSATDLDKIIDHTLIFHNHETYQW
jgi:hypothetical protein